MPYDFEQAQRKIAPLLSALVSGADYLFDLSPRYDEARVRYRLTPLTAIGYDVGNAVYDWEKDRLRLKEVGPVKISSAIPRSEKALENSGLTRAITELLKQAARLG